MTAPQPLDVFHVPLGGVRLIEASAGTGKTWAICGLYLRLLLEQRCTVQQILVVTFTNAATAELLAAVDHAATRTTENAARQWLLQTADAFATERSFLAHLSVALGPVPSTIGHNDNDAAVLQQRHALDMLAQSDRRGCAMGAALTLAIDWLAIRHLLDATAIRVGIEPPACRLPTRSDSLAVAREIATDEAAARAIQFGARQLLSQHRGLFDLLKARAEIRTLD